MPPTSTRAINKSLTSWRDTAGPDDGVTVGRLFGYLLNSTFEGLDREQLANDTFFWPPDVFGLCAAILRKSACYAPTLTDNLASRVSGQLELPNKLLAAAVDWRRCSVMSAEQRLGHREPENNFLKKLRTAWNKIWDEPDLLLDAIRDDDALVKNLFELLATADLVCEDIGLPSQPKPSDAAAMPLNPEESRLMKRFRDLTMDYLTPGLRGSTLCKFIHPTVARVLPKTHVPVAGLTIRSFSRYLAYCESEEVQPRWFLVPGARGNPAEQNHVNILVVPWPLELTPAKIRKSRDGGELALRKGQDPRDAKHHMFTCDSEEPGVRPVSVISALCAEAKKKLGSLDAVVLPELALSPSDYTEVRDWVLSQSMLLICGVGRSAENSETGDNFLCIDVPLSEYHAVHFRQSKHHRWRLDRNQINQYGLGARLHPEDVYWEDIGVDDRRLLFVVLRPWLVTCGLICEDLARHDPVGELVRGVGPHLVVALLMDGPQRVGRWSARYATSLADDPGSSVLSVTSLGMSRLTEGYYGNKESRKVALWKDIETGSPRELELPPGADALVLSLTVRKGRETTADSRSFEATSPILTGVHAVSRPKTEATEEQPPGELKWLSPSDATVLARLVQHDPNSEEFPRILSLLDGESRLIGIALWHLLKDRGDTPQQRTQEAQRAKNREKRWKTHNELEAHDCYSGTPNRRHIHTAQRIVDWNDTNRS